MVRDWQLSILVIPSNGEPQAHQRTGLTDQLAVSRSIPSRASAIPACTKQYTTGGIQATAYGEPVSREYLARRAT